MTADEKLARIYLELRVTTFAGAMAELSLLPQLKKDLLLIRKGMEVRDKNIERLLSFRNDANAVLITKKQRISDLAALLDRVPHHGPNGSYSKAEGQCWPDCVACERDKLNPPCS